MKNHKQTYVFLLLLPVLFPFSSIISQVDPDTAQRARIDRFSMRAGHLFVRDSINNFPGLNEP